MYIYVNSTNNSLLTIVPINHDNSFFVFSLEEHIGHSLNLTFIFQFYLYRYSKIEPCSLDVYTIFFITFQVKAGHIILK